MKNNCPDIIKVELTKFDPDTLARALRPTKDLPVKLFVNCKSSKRSSKQGSKSGRPGDEGMESEDVDLGEEGSTGAVEDLITREEIYFTGKENIEGLACLLNVFLGAMMASSSHPAVLNIDNHEELTGDRIKRG